MYRLNEKQLDQLANFASNLSLIYLTSIIAPFFSKVDKLDLFSVVLGLTAATLSLIVSLSLGRKIKS